MSEKITINIGRIKKSLDENAEQHKIKLVLKPGLATGDKRPREESENKDAMEDVKVNNSEIKDREYAVPKSPASPMRNLIFKQSAVETLPESSTPQQKGSIERLDDDSANDQAEIEKPKKKRRVDMNFLKSFNYSLGVFGSSVQGSPYSPTAPERNSSKRKGQPVRAIPYVHSFQQRVKHQIIKLEFLGPETKSEESSQDAYLKSLVAFYKSKNDIQRLRMKRRHERIIARGIQLEQRRAKEEAARASGKRVHKVKEVDHNNEKPNKPKGKRGRPRIHPLPAPQVASPPVKTPPPPPPPIETKLSPVEQHSNSSSPSSGSPRSRQPLDIYNHPMASMLSDEEKELCVNARVLPDQYLNAKDQLLAAYEKIGFFHKTAARKYVKGIDVNRLGKIWEFFVGKGYLKQEQ